MSTTWTAVLDDCEARLDALEAALDAGAPPAVGPFAPVVPTDDLPAPFTERARALVERGDRLVARLAADRDQVRDQLRRMPRVPPATRA